MKDETKKEAEDVYQEKNLWYHKNKMGQITGPFYSETDAILDRTKKRQAVEHGERPI